MIRTRCWAGRKHHRIVKEKQNWKEKTPTYIELKRSKNANWECSRDMKDGQEISVYLRILVPKLTTEQWNQNKLTKETDRAKKCTATNDNGNKFKRRKTYENVLKQRTFDSKRIIILCVFFFYFNALKSSQTKKKWSDDQCTPNRYFGIKINFSICLNVMCALGTVIPLSQMLITYILTLYAIRWLLTHPKTFTKLLCMMWIFYLSLPFFSRRIITKWAGPKDENFKCLTIHSRTI